MRINADNAIRRINNIAFVHHFLEMMQNKKRTFALRDKVYQARRRKGETTYVRIISIAIWAKIERMRKCDEISGVILRSLSYIWT